MVVLTAPVVFFSLVECCDDRVRMVLLLWQRSGRRIWLSFNLVLMMMMRILVVNNSRNCSVGFVVTIGHDLFVILRLFLVERALEM